jgi:hypothetical protein
MPPLVPPFLPWLCVGRLESAGNPLAKPIYGRPVNTAALLGKDATNKGATFTAQMQPLIQPGEQVLRTGLAVQ